ncbi:hypothetical protein CULT_180037 [[Clostridium] ultunense Esp]|nr:hypothetical protein CULT_180037 [[Clostridium] ultunense Esp]
MIDVGRESITIEATGSSDKIEALIELLRLRDQGIGPYGYHRLHPGDGTGVKGA